MTAASVFPVLGYSIALVLFAIGFLRIAMNLDAPRMCCRCVMIGAAEAACGVGVCLLVHFVMTGYV